MTVLDHLRVLRERWIAVLISILVTVVAAAGVYLVQPPQYTAGLQMYVSSPLTQTPDTVYSATQIAQNRAKSFTELATSYRVTSTVVDRLRLNTTPAELQDRIAATNSTDSVVIDLSVVDRSPVQAAAIANAVGVALQETVGDVERPQVPGAVAPVDIRAVQPAPVPTEPSSTGLKRLLGIGLLLGIAIGVAVAFARNALDNTIKSVDDLRRVSDAPSLGSIANSPKISKRPLIVHDDPQNPRSEDFRKLRTNLQFVDVGNPNKILTITSAVPGEGKTTTTVNLAIALATAGSRVLLIDADLRRPKAAELLGIDGAVGLTSVLSQRISLSQAIQVWDQGAFDVLASGPVPPNPSELLASEHTRKLLADLRGRYDFIVIDTSPLLPVTDAAAIAQFTDGAILVCRAQKTTRSQASAASAALRAVDVPLRGSVLTMMQQSVGVRSGYEGVYQIDTSLPPSLGMSNRATSSRSTYHGAAVAGGTLPVRARRQSSDDSRASAIRPSPNGPNGRNQNR